MGLECLKSKVLILKANMQVIVLKSVWGPGSFPRGHEKKKKKVFYLGGVYSLPVKWHMFPVFRTVPVQNDISKGKKVI